MVCALLPFTNCTTLEYQRWNALFIWIDRFQNLKFTGPSLSAYLDKLVNKAKVYTPKLIFDKVYLSTYGYTFNIDSYRSNWTYIKHNQTDLSFIAFNSSQLRIDIQNTVLSNYNSSFACVNFTFYLPKGSKPSVLKFTYNSSSSSSLTNG